MRNECCAHASHRAFIPAPSTSFMSNRGRQNVASLLTKDLYYDWRLGAEWFESLLIDYDPSSNYGNVSWTRWMTGERKRG